jgi:hypothetical protein
VLDEADLDPSLERVKHAVLRTRDVESRLAGVFRRTFDQLYDGQHTGRYSWPQLFKTEKTHFGTLVEINIRREFDELIDDGSKLDFSIAGEEVDCKYSQAFGGWMLPPESFGELILVCTANDASSEWAVGLVRVRDEFRRPGVNRDLKSGLNQTGRDAIHWLFRPGDLAPNVLLRTDPEVRAQIFGHRSGQQRLNELFRSVTNVRIGRNTVATVAQQDDYMKRVRTNGGARSALASEGIIICGGDYESHRSIARDLGLPVPEPGEFVSARVAPASGEEPFWAVLEGQMWRVAEAPDPVVAAPALPSTKK